MRRSFAGIMIRIAFADIALRLDAVDGVKLGIMDAFVLIDDGLRG